MLTMHYAPAEKPFSTIWDLNNLHFSSLRSVDASQIFLVTKALGGSSFSHTKLVQWNLSIVVTV